LQTIVKMLIEACRIGTHWNRNVTTKVEKLQQKNVEKLKELLKLIKTRIVAARNTHWNRTNEQKSCCQNFLKMTEQERREKLLQKNWRWPSKREAAKKKSEDNRARARKKLLQKANEDDRMIARRGATANKQNSHEVEQTRREAPALNK
jgi:hypothetical protein